MFLGVLCLCLSVCIYAFVVGEERGKRGGGGGPGGGVREGGNSGVGG